jgi:hypothetical protein
MVIDKLTASELDTMHDILLKKNTIQANIKRLIEMEMEIDIQLNHTLIEIMRIHSLDASAGYQLQPNGEITL